MPGICISSGKCIRQGLVACTVSAQPGSTRLCVKLDVSFACDVFQCGSYFTKPSLVAALSCMCSYTLPLPLVCIGLKHAALTQVRRAGAVAVTKAVADKAQLELLDLDGNEISDSAIDDIKVHQVGKYGHARVFDSLALSGILASTAHCSCSIVPDGVSCMCQTCYRSRSMTCSVCPAYVCGPGLHLGARLYPFG